MIRFLTSKEHCEKADFNWFAEQYKDVTCPFISSSSVNALVKYTPRYLTFLLKFIVWLYSTSGLQGHS